MSARKMVHYSYSSGRNRLERMSDPESDEHYGSSTAPLELKTSASAVADDLDSADAPAARAEVGNMNL